MTAEARLQHQVGSREICGGHNGTRDRVFLEYVSFALSVSFHKRAVLVFCILLLPEGQTSEVWEPSVKQRSFGNRGATEEKVLVISR